VKTKHVLVPDINDHLIQIKNTYYSCIYLTCILYCFSKLNVNVFKFLLLGKMGSGSMAYLVVLDFQGNTVYLRITIETELRDSSQPIKCLHRCTSVVSFCLSFK
jgi:hypothetical protein